MTLYRLVCINGHRWREPHPVARLIQILRSSGTQAVTRDGYGLRHVVFCPYCGDAAVDVAKVETTPSTQ